MAEPTRVGSVTLRDYQENAVKALRWNMGGKQNPSKVTRQILCAPTGAGKTEMAMAIIDGARGRDSRVAFVCDRQSLVRQTSDRFASAGIRHGILMGNDTVGVHEKIRICTAQSLLSRGFHQVDLMVIDECHDKFNKLLDFAKGQEIRTIGLSATPMTPGLGDFYQTIVNATTTNRLITDGYLSPIKVVAPVATVDVSGLKVSSTGEWVREEVGKRARRIVGNVLKEWEGACKTHYNGEFVKTIAFCASIGDAEALTRRMAEAGHDFRVVHSKRNEEENAADIRAYRDGKCTGLVNVNMLTRGFDVPDTQILLDLAPVRSAVHTLVQRYGRVMRVSPGKLFGLILDFAENFLAFSPDLHEIFENGIDTLDDKRKRKVRNADDMEKRRTEYLCRQCQTPIPPSSRTCPACGWEKPHRPVSDIERVHGSLGHVDNIDGKARASGGRQGRMRFDGDPWPHICSWAWSRHGADDEKVQRLAAATYRNLTGKNAWTRPLASLEGPCDMEVERACENSLRRYIYAQKKKRKGAGA